MFHLSVGRRGWEVGTHPCSSSASCVKSCHFHLPHRKVSDLVERIRPEVGLLSDHDNKTRDPRHLP